MSARATVRRRLDIAGRWRWVYRCSETRCFASVSGLLWGSQQAALRMAERHLSTEHPEQYRNPASAASRRAVANLRSASC